MFSGCLVTPMNIFTCHLLAKFNKCDLQVEKQNECQLITVGWYVVYVFNNYRDSCGAVESFPKNKG
ncbi:hypothetical protein LA52FAK_07540 [Desulforhopalus sp. 52FAK]